MLALPDLLLEQIARRCLLSKSLPQLCPSSPLDISSIEEGDVQTFFAFAGTCSRTRLASSSCLQHLKFDQSRPAFANHQYKVLANRFRLVPLAGNNLRSLRLTSILFEKADNAEEYRNTIVSGLGMCVNLQVLRINCCLGSEMMLMECVDISSRYGSEFLPNLLHLVVEAGRLSSVKKVANDFLLSIAKAPHFRSLTSLDLQAIRYASTASIQKMLKSDIGNRLSHLRLGEPVNAPSEKVCSLISSICSNLESLELYLWSSAKQGSHALCRQLGSRLRCLVLSVCEWDDGDLIETLQNCRGLKSLTVTQCSITSDALVTGLLFRNQVERIGQLKLEHLTIAGQRDWGNQHFRLLSCTCTAGNLPSPIQSLRSLSIIAGPSSLSCEGLFAVLECCGETLESFELRGSYDFIASDGATVLRKLVSSVRTNFKHLKLVGYPQGISSSQVWELLNPLARQLSTLDVSVQSDSVLETLEAAASFQGHKLRELSITCTLPEDVDVAKSNMIVSKNLCEGRNRVQNAFPLASVRIVERV